MQRQRSNRKRRDSKVMTKQVATLQAEIFDSVTWRTDRLPVDPNFRWHTMDCQLLTAQEINTPHLFNCVKMMWNNLVPLFARIKPFTEYKGVKQMPREERRYAIRNLFNELMNRNDRSKSMDEAILKMMKFAGDYYNIRKIFLD